MSNNYKNSSDYEEQSFNLSPKTREKIYCILAYIYILWLVGLLSDKENRKVRFHVNQGIILSIVLFSSLIIINILSIILYSIAPILASLTAFLQLTWICASIAFISIGIINVLKDNMIPLPLIGNMFSILK